jgi:hypothetical protein
MRRNVSMKQKAEPGGGPVFLYSETFALQNWRTSPLVS